MFSFITNIFAALSGKKTYLTAFIGAAVVALNHFFPGALPGVTLDPGNWIPQILVTAGGAFLRSAIGSTA